MTRKAMIVMKKVLVLVDDLLFASRIEGTLGACGYDVRLTPVMTEVAQVAREWGPDGIRSNVVSPGMVITPMSQAFYDTPGVTERRSAVTPMRRIAMPQDIADAVMFLASDRASYVTGAEIGATAFADLAEQSSPRRPLPAAAIELVLDDVEQPAMQPLHQGQRFQIQRTDPLEALLALGRLHRLHDRFHRDAPSFRFLDGPCFPVP